MPMRNLWFIELDSITLPIKVFNEEILLEVGEDFSSDKISNNLERADIDDNHMLVYVGEGIKEIVKTLYNFFIVEEKLSNHPLVKRFFSSLMSLLRTEMSYAELFVMRSEHFLYYRIMACLIRQSKFYKFLYYKIEEHKGDMDKAFFENMREVYLYMLQKYKEILLHEAEESSVVEVSKIQILMIHQLNVLMIFFDFPVKDVVYNELIEEEYVTEIIKYNIKYYEFQSRPPEEQVVIVELGMEMDTVFTERPEEEDEEG